jgi:hypothetical protein
MAKELPYFKFEPAEYLTKDISFCSISAQGLFINICSYYWQRQCSLTLEQISRRFNYPNELDELIKEGIIDVTENTISIKFLDNQLDEVSKLSNKNSANGSKGGRPKKNPNETQTKPNLNPTESQTKGIREEEIREDEIKEDNIKEEEEKEINRAIALESDFEIFWNAYDKKVDYKKTKAKFISLSGVKRQQALNTVLFYVKKTEEKKYRKNPWTWLHNECWKDELAVMKIEDVQEPKRNYTFAELMERDAVTKTNL